MIQYKFNKYKDMVREFDQPQICNLEDDNQEQ